MLANCRKVKMALSKGDWRGGGNADSDSDQFLIFLSCLVSYFKFNKHKYVDSRKIFMKFLILG
jgi:hypothetical protein